MLIWEEMRSSVSLSCFTRTALRSNIFNVTNRIHSTTREEGAPRNIYSQEDYIRSFKESHRNIFHSVCFTRVYNEYKMLPRTSNSSCVHAHPSSYPRHSLDINVRGCSLPQEFRFCYVFGSSLSISRLILMISVPWLTERPSWLQICPTLDLSPGSACIYTERLNFNG